MRSLNSTVERFAHGTRAAGAAVAASTLMAWTAPAHAARNQVAGSLQFLGNGWTGCHTCDSTAASAGGKRIRSDGRGLFSISLQAALTMKRSAIALALFSSAVCSHAAVLDFSGDICAAASTGVGAFVPCSPIGGLINQAYGDTALIDFKFQFDTTPAGANISMSHYGVGYFPLSHVAYGSFLGPQITMTALAGSQITLTGFDLGSFGGFNDTMVQVFDLAGGPALINTGTITIPAFTGRTIVVNAVSSAGFKILFGPDGFNVGISNIGYSVSPVPEPATGALMAAGLAFFSAAGRYRRRRQAASR